MGREVLRIIKDEALQENYGVIQLTVHSSCETCETCIPTGGTGGASHHQGRGAAGERVAHRCPLAKRSPPAGEAAPLHGARPGRGKRPERSQIIRNPPLGPPLGPPLKRPPLKRPPLRGLRQLARRHPLLLRGV
eukprot:69380-Prorocentrum_minimum.AAC.2